MRSHIVAGVAKIEEIEETKLETITESKRKLIAEIRQSLETIVDAEDEEGTAEEQLTTLVIHIEQTLAPLVKSDR